MVSIIRPTAALPELMSASLTSFRALGSMPDMVGRRRVVSCEFVFKVKFKRNRVEEINEM